MGENLKILKSYFWPEKSTNIGLEHTKRCGIATFGGMFSKKSWFCQYFHEKIMILGFEITMELRCNLKKSKIMIFSWKYRPNKLFLENIPPPHVAIPHLLVYSRQILVNFSGQKRDFKIFWFSPIIKSPFSN